MIAVGSLRSVVSGLAACLALGALAGCGGADPADRAVPAQRTRFSQQLHDQLPAPVRSRGGLSILTAADYAPIMFYLPDGRHLQGSEADLAAALGRVLGVTVAFVPADFPTILPRLARGEADLGMSGITDTRARERTVDFVDYFQAGTSLLVQRGNPHAIGWDAALCGHRVGVGQDTIQEELAHRLQKACTGPPLTVVRATTSTDAMLELRSGDVEATLVDYPPAVLMTTDPKSRAFYQLASDRQYEPAPFGVAVSRTRPGLAPVIERALAQIQSSGEYREVLARWNLTSGAIPNIGLNIAS